MKRYWKNKLLKAMRSGKYRKCTGFLRRGDNERRSFCISGIVADIVDPEGWKHVYGSWRHRDCCLFLPREIRDKTGLTNDECTTLVDINDYNPKLSHEETADLVAEALK